MEELSQLYEEILNKKSLIKIIFSAPEDKDTVRVTGRIIALGKERAVQLETLKKDGKALHRNLPETDAAKEFTRLSAAFRRVNLITTGGTCEVLTSKRGKRLIRNAIKGEQVVSPAEKNDREHRFLLDPIAASSFLSKLGVCDERGTIFDRKRAKFRQINRFVEILDDSYPFLPQEGALTVLDLCCGKSYLTFAVYYYLTQIKKRSVNMYGVDLKSDVISFCRETAKQLRFDDLHFECMNIFDFTPPSAPDLVVSLHACDIATDIVLYTAVRFGARVVLSTPCCHHEMFNQLSCQALSFADKSMYKQKLCDAFTDALRCKRLEAEGYKVTALELIDPEETPKNVLIKAIRANVPQKKRAQAMEEYEKAVAFLGVDPYLDKLFKEAKE